MTKIMLVEDDKSLREIYGVRLLAEGYDIVSAGDGELALAMAIKERPDLIISDVMMPKISGFDMLDILRSTTETKNIKVIMMTALSSEEQRARGEQLGADRYLVKSQVGIEDVVRVVHEVLGDAPGSRPASADNTPRPSKTGPTPPQQRATPSPASATTAPSAPPIPPQPAPNNPSAPVAAPRQATLGERVIQPLKDNPRTNTVDINQLLDKEMAKNEGVTLPPAQSQATPATSPPAPTPTPAPQSSLPTPNPIQSTPPPSPVATPPATPSAPAPQQPPAQSQLQQDMSAQLDQLIAQDKASRTAPPAPQPQPQPAPAQPIPQPQQPTPGSGPHVPPRPQQPPAQPQQ